MNRAFTQLGWRRLALLSVVGLGLSIGPWAGAGGEPPLEKITVNGKYSKLLRKLHEPGDVQKFTTYCDWGLSLAQDYGNHKNVPKGFWVYVAPNWYIWAHKDSSKDFAMRKASADGKYDNLLHRIGVPEDRKQFGIYKEFGFSNAKNYGNHTDIPAGFWVYHFPHWYVWGKKGKELDGDVLKASMNCKYTHLLKKIPIPQDQKVFGNFYEEGYTDVNHYGPFKNLPPGYWVYLAPNWYIWGDLRNTKVKLHD